MSQTLTSRNEQLAELTGTVTMLEAEKKQIGPKNS